VSRTLFITFLPTYASKQQTIEISKMTLSGADELVLLSILRDYQLALRQKGVDFLFSSQNAPQNAREEQWAVIGQWFTKKTNITLKDPTRLALLAIQVKTFNIFLHFPG
jgi:hypothetical protein